MEIVYPVYLLGNKKPETTEKVTYYISSLESENGDIHKIRIVDDKTLPQQSLALRRLALKAQDTKLYKINKTIFFLGDLIKLSTSNTWFIDSVGKVFKYVKTARAKLDFYKIIQIINIPTGGTVVEVVGMSTRFKTLYAPNFNETATYAGILTLNKGPILYGLYDQKYDSTWRLI